MQLAEQPGDPTCDCWTSHRQLEMTSEQLTRPLQPHRPAATTHQARAAVLFGERKKKKEVKVNYDNPRASLKSKIAFYPTLN